MFDTSKIDKKLYSDLMDNMKKMSVDYRNVRKSKYYKLGFAILYTLENILRFNFKPIKGYYTSINGEKKLNKRRLSIDSNKENNYLRKSNYFSNEKIVIYTSIFGEYDSLAEPLSVPDNCEYYIITDQEVSDKSIWKKYDFSKFSNEISKLSNIEKNRYFKMHPHLLFPDYNYSIYIDGNIKIITDLTEYIYYIEEGGFAAHLHSKRDCVFDEFDAVKIFKKDTKENIEYYRKLLMKRNMPRHYGMLECNVLVREHNNEKCIEIMKEWWKEFCISTKRDQLSLPYVLFKYGYRIEDIGKLGTNIFLNPSFRIERHKKK